MGIEQFRPGHQHGSSHGDSRLFRVACLEGADYVALARHALGMWHALEQESGQQLYVRTGGLMIGAPGSSTVKGTRAAVREHKMTCESLDAATTRARYPQHRLDDDDVTVVDPDAGVLHPERAIVAAVDRARALGASVLTGARATRVDADAAGVTVHTSTGTLRGRRAVVSVGAWSASLLPQLRLPLRVTRQVMTWFNAVPDAADSYVSDRFPIFLRETPGGGGAWGHGSIDGSPVKLGPEDFGGPAIEPDDLDTAIHDDDLRPMEAYAAQWLHGLRPTVVKAQTCMMTTTPDEHFIVGPHRALPNVTVLAGFSGHGFKHAAGIGDAAACLALDEAVPVPLGLFDPGRFG